jgi:hypothetical protein
MARINENDLGSRLPATAFSAYDFGLRATEPGNRYEISAPQPKAHNSMPVLQR